MSDPKHEVIAGISRKYLIRYEVAEFKDGVLQRKAALESGWHYEPEIESADWIKTELGMRLEEGKQ